MDKAQEPSSIATVFIVLRHGQLQQTSSGIKGSRLDQLENVSLKTVVVVPLTSSEMHGMEQSRETLHTLKTNDGWCRGLTEEEIIRSGKPLVESGQPIFCSFGLQNRNGFNCAINVINVLKPLINVVEAGHGLGELFDDKQIRLFINILIADSDVGLQQDSENRLLLYALNSMIASKPCALCAQPH
jgi:hypothetical protein